LILVSVVVPGCRLDLVAGPLEPASAAAHCVGQLAGERAAEVVGARAFGFDLDHQPTPLEGTSRELAGSLLTGILGPDGDVRGRFLPMRVAGVSNTGGDRTSGPA
jgi:hypothetical protein